MQAAIVINEILPDPAGADASNEWVELYNTEAISVMLDGYILEDKNGKKFTLSGTLDKWLVVYPQGGGFALTNTGSTIKLIRDGQAQDNFTYGSSDEDKSFGRIPDGGEISADKLTPTAGTANALAATATPTPFPTPSPTPTPTSTPIPPTPKATGGTVATPKPTASAQVLAAKTETEPDSEVTIAAEIQATATASAIPQPEIKKQGKWPWLMMIGGGGLAIAALFPFLRKWYDEGLWRKMFSRGGDQSSFGQE